jgi:uncharacterized protein YbbC (DUF1343 family)
MFQVGYETLIQQHLDLIHYKRVGVLTNAGAIDARGIPVYKSLRDRRDVKVTAYFSPEHGLDARLDEEGIGDRRYMGVPVYSLYGAHRAPTPAQLKTVDVLLFDLQDVGARYYTYASTLGLTMAACAAAHVPLVVLDRPNPLGSVREGALLRPAFRHFTGRYAWPVRHGMSMGQMATWIKHHETPEVNLSVMPYVYNQSLITESQWLLKWAAPSPAIRSAEDAFYYIGLGLFECTNLDCRGGERPFHWVGASYIRSSQTWLNSLGPTPGFRLTPKTMGHTSGLSVEILDKRASALELGMKLLYHAVALYGRSVKVSRSGLGIMTGDDQFYQVLFANPKPDPVAFEQLLQRNRAEAASFDPTH